LFNLRWRQVVIGNPFIMNSDLKLSAWAEPAKVGKYEKSNKFRIQVSEYRGCMRINP